MARGGGHRLDPLLRPQSIAVVGASRRNGSVGNSIVKNLQAGGFKGSLYAVNPGYEDVHGVPCFPTLADLPQRVEHVAFAVADSRIEAVLREAIHHGALAATLYSTLVLPHDTTPPLRDRVQALIDESRLVVCGGNGMGFMHPASRVQMFGFETRDHAQDGNVSYISHSGSGMAGIADVDERIQFNLAVSTGQELSVTMDEYLDFALDLPDTRVVGLFVETARNPSGLVQALEKAQMRDIPIVALKVGSTTRSAELTVAHCGALAGNNAAYAALFERHGVTQVRDLEELAHCLILFAQPHKVGRGGLVCLHDSGGERQLAVDVAEQVGLPLTVLAQDSAAKLEAILDPGLPAVNPLDGWSAGGPNADKVMAESLAIMMSDSDAAMGAVIHDRDASGGIWPDYRKYLERGHAAAGKPVALVSNWQGTGSDPNVVAWTHDGFPVLDGIRPFFVAVKALLDRRDFVQRQDEPAGDVDVAPIDAAVTAFLEEGTRGEFESSQLLAACGMPMNRSRLAETAHGALVCARELSFPVALKTAEDGVSHKTDVGGVCLEIDTEQVLVDRYAMLAEAFGPRVLVTPMVTDPGVEMILGLQVDDQFGPLVVFGFGGVYAELLRDTVTAMPPFGPDFVKRKLTELTMAPLLTGFRDRKMLAVDRYAEAVACFSQVVLELGKRIVEIDMNPILLTEHRCVALDALVVPRTR